MDSFIHVFDPLESLSLGLLWGHVFSFERDPSVGALIFGRSLEKSRDFERSRFIVLSARRSGHLHRFSLLDKVRDCLIGNDVKLYSVKNVHHLIDKRLLNVKISEGEEQGVPNRIEVSFGELAQAPF